MLKIVYPICCGIDVHKSFIVATVGTTDIHGVTSYQTRNFYTYNKDLNSFKDWLAKHNCKDICMESTGKYWIPIFNYLEDYANITLANPKHIKAIKGKKTDKKDSVWITDLFKHDLVPGSFIPSKDIRQLRDLTRYSFKYKGMITSEKNRIQNSLTVSNIALDSFVSDIFGKSSTKIIDYLLTIKSNQFDKEMIRPLLHGKMKSSFDNIINSLEGFNISDEQNFKLLLARKNLNDLLDKQYELQNKLRELSSVYQGYISLLKTIPGIEEKSAIIIISEIGVDLSSFPNSQKLCNWAGLTPTNNESAGKKKSTRISRAGVYLKPTLVQCALCAITDKSNDYFKLKYNKLKKRRGHNKAIIAICRMMLTSIYHMFITGEVFNPKDFNYSDESLEKSEQRKLSKINDAISFLQRQGIDTSSINLESLTA